MPATEQEIMDAAKSLGDLVADHPAVEKLAEAQQALAADPTSSRLLQSFDQKLQVVARNQQMGQPVTEADRQELEQLQNQLAGDLKVESFNAAQVEFTDMLRKVSEAWQKPIAAKQGMNDGGPADAGAGPGGPGGAGGGASPFSIG